MSADSVSEMGASAVQQADERSIAIIGLSCRMPGNCDGVDGYWSTLRDGRCAIGPVANRQWRGTAGGRWAALLDQIDRFDAEFFGISPREATMLDPQQRLLLEVGAEAAASAGVRLSALRKTRTGIFVASGALDYQAMIRETKLDAHRNVYSVTGNGGAFAAGRLAYFFGTEGPCVGVDTTCSSSLVAVHLAVESLRDGRCELAFAGGVNLVLAERVMDEIVLLRALSPTGACRTFDARADGFVRGEGCGVVVLKPLVNALRDGDEVFAVIAGSAINHDGRSTGLTVPNGAAQERVVRSGLDDAAVPPDQVGYVEAHGTGTPLGDPIEVSALRAVLDGDAAAAPARRCALGSVKANIGHLEAAAGVAGLIKVVLALRNELIPPQVGFETLNPRIALDRTRFVIPVEAMPWPRGAVPRVGAVSSFGMSGTNAHVVVMEAPSARPAAVGHDHHLVTLSSRSHAGLIAEAARHAAHVVRHPEQVLADIAWTSAVARDPFDHRLAVVAATPAELEAKLRAFAESPPSPAPAHRRRGNAGVGFLFTGQGSQYTGMGHGLMGEPAFRRAIERCDEIAAGELGPGGLSAALAADPACIDQTRFTQPALFAVEYALSELWKSWGLEPAVVLGHSVGEYVAACVAGVMMVEDALRIVMARGRLMQSLPAGGAMVAVRATEPEVRRLLHGRTDAVSIAGFNGPDQLVISGTEDGVAMVCRELADRGAKVKPLVVSHAFHSPMMRPIVGAFEEVVQGCALRAPRIALISNVTGALAGAEVTTASYWGQHILEGVRFEQGFRAMLACGVTTFVEIGPHPVLAGMASAFAGDDGLRFLPSLRRGEPDRATILRAAGDLYAAGHELAWDCLHGARRRVQLPPYAFMRQRFWFERGDDGGAAADVEGAGLDPAGHPLLGASIAVADGDRFVFSGRLSLETHRWLADHVVAGRVLLPGTGFLELALAAAERVGADGIDDLTLEEPLVLPASGAVRIQLSVGPMDDGGRRSFALHARSEDAPWTRHASGTLGAVAPRAAMDLRSWPPDGATPLELDGFYDRVADAGLVYGEAFRGLVAAYQRDRDLFVEVALPTGSGGSEAQAGRFSIHPAVLDAALHGLILHAPDGGVELPFSWGGVRWTRKGCATLRARLSRAEAQGAVTLELADGRTGEPVGIIEALRMRAEGRARDDRQRQVAGARFVVEWGELPAPGPASPVPWVAVGGARVPHARVHNPDLAAVVADGSPAPPLVVMPCWSAADAAGEIATAARRAASDVLAMLHAFVADPRFAASRLVVLTRRAIATHAEEDVLDLGSAVVWGLVRSAQSEHPGRFALLDLDVLDVAEPALLAALRSDEPQLALRHSALRVPRLVRAAPPRAADRPALAAHGTVLVTGGTGTLGAMVARHLIVAHGVRHLVLCSRTGGGEALVEELRELGAEVRVVACDVSQRAAVHTLLAEIPAEHPLTAVVHTAGVIDDGVLESLTAERFDRVFGPKLDGALHLHDLTWDMNLAAFVMYSSVAGVLGSPGQGNYAAANALLDALAHHRRAQGRAATSLAWGYWEQRSGITHKLSDADVARLASAGLLPMTEELGLALFDEALRSPAPLVVSARLDLPQLAASERGRHALFQRLVRRTTHAPARSRPVASQLAALPAEQRDAALRDLVHAAAAGVLGTEASAIDPQRPLRELGLDSLMAVELRNRLAAVTGLRLPSTLSFDHPTLERLTSHLAGALAGPAAPIAIAPAPADEPRDDDDPIAIVAMSCRYPGDVESPDGLWQLIASGTDAISEFPTRRGWDTDAIYDPDPDAVGKTLTRSGGFLHRADEFDPEFFGISRREAMAIDPQQRLLLELTWELLERAGIDPTALVGSQTGVFVGVMYSDYGARPLQAAGDVEGYLSIGSAPSVASGRIAYSFGFQGPALTIDTACSSSLVGLHLACQSLHRGECSLALAGGVTVMATPSPFIHFSRQRGLAPDGRCKAFSARADGTAWAEGAGLVLLERLSDARRLGHEVLALVRGSAVNQDGKSQGLTAPNGPAQEQVILQALRSANVPAATIDVVEAHGTGTALGDPIEARALRATYGAAHTAENPVWLGSLKSNLGHTQAAAGVGGAIKMLLALRRGVMPQTLHAAEPSPHVDWSSGNLRLLHEPRPWPRNGHPRRAAVSSFGVSGTNAHVILEEAPVLAPPAAPDTAREQRPVVLPLSAKTRDALVAIAGRYADYLEGAGAEVALEDIAYTAGVHRVHHAHRLAVAGRTRGELVSALRGVAQGERPGPTTALGPQPALRRPRTVFVFSGQGSQWTGMGQKLFDAEPVFRAKLEECDAGLRRHAHWSIRDWFVPEPRAELVEQTRFQQPILFALQVALAAQLGHWGIAPDAVLGHSVGEIAAAHVSGALSLDAAMRIVVRRAEAMQQASGLGKMVWVALPADEAARVLERRGQAVVIGAVNDPRSVVLSGDAAAIDAVVAELAARPVECRMLKVRCAFHSPHMDAAARALVTELEHLESGPPGVPFYSTVTRAMVSAALDRAYWGRNLREPVQFAGAVAASLEDGHHVFVEIGPHPQLAANLAECIAHQGVTAQVVDTLRRNGDDAVRLHAAAARLYTHGAAVDWKALQPDRRIVELPTYAWQRERYWIEAANPRASIAASRPGTHPLLGAVFIPASAPHAHYWETSLDLARVPYLADHRVQGQIVFPSSGYLEMAIAAAAEVYGSDGLVIEDVVFEQLLVLEGERRVQVSLVTTGDAGQFEIASRGEGEAAWVRHARGTARRATTAPGDDASLRWEPATGTHETTPPEAHYARLAAMELDYGPAFRGVQHIRTIAGEAQGHVVLPAGAGDPARYRAHPALLDACLQVSAALLAAHDAGRMLVPVGIDRLAVHGALPRSVSVCARRGDPALAGGPVMDLAVSSEAGEPVLALRGLRLQQVARREHDALGKNAYVVRWTEAPGPVPAAARGSTGSGAWIVLADATGVGGGVASRLRDAGRPCYTIEIGERFARIAADRYVIDPADPEHHARLLREILDQGALAGMVHAWSLDAAGMDGATAERITADLRRICLSLLLVTRELAKHGWRDAPRLVLVTRGAQAAGDVPLASVSQAPAWAMARTIAMELPDLSWTRVDLDPVSIRGELSALVEEVLGANDEDQIALRATTRLVARLERHPLPPAPPVAFAPDASYLITGGLGGLGLSVARWMVERGARHLALVSRRKERSPHEQDAVAALRATGAEVVVLSADVSVLSEVQGVIDQLGRQLPPLRGIVHAAATLDDRTLVAMTEASFWVPFSAKAMGAWNLHVATHDFPLDFFVLYSSAVALLGSPGQTNYAAANGFLDALAHWRTARGLPATSVQWGPFSDVGMAAALATRGGRLGLHGIQPFTPDEGNALLGRVLARSEAEIALVSLSVAQLVEAHPRLSSARFLDRVRAAEPVVAPITPALRTQLLAAPRHQRAAQLERHIVALAAKTLAIPPEAVDPAAPFQSLGLDSMMSLELKSGLEASLGLKLPATLLFTYATTEALTAHLAERLDAELGSASPPPPRSPAATVDLSDLSATELVAALDQQIATARRRRN